MTNQAGNPTKGVMLITGAVLIFAMADVVTKHLASLYPVPVVILLRYAVNVVLLLALLYPSQGAGLWKTRRSGLVTLRALVLCAASVTMAMALRVMPVGEASAIVYLSPFAVMLLAVPLLGEKINLVGWVGATLGFLGVFLIVRPGGNLDPWGVTWCLVNAGCATAYNLMTRLLARTETTHALLFNTAAVGVAVFGIMSIGQWDFPRPGVWDMALMGLLGVLMTTGHFLFTAAYREAPASLIAPLTYVQLFWAGGLGWLIFGHVPDGLSLTGIALVMVAGGAIALRSQFDARRARLMEV